MYTSRHLRLSVFTVFFLCLVVALSSCSKKEVRNDGELVGGELSGEEEMSEMDSGEAIEGEGDVGTADLADAMPGTTVSDLQTVYFDYDRYNLRSDTRATLQSNADWMNGNPNAVIQIEGHCDERGTNEYNLALGERRANAAKTYLVGLGVDPSRIEIISYGEERPSSADSNEAAWSENRRAEFVVLSQ